MNRRMVLLLIGACFGALAGATASPQSEVPQIVLKLPLREGVTRNSEGSFLRLRDGRILFVYSRFRAVESDWQFGSDHSPADIAARYSADNGLTWSAEDRIVVARPKNSANVMSTDLLRLPDGRILLAYCRKDPVPGSKVPRYTVCVTFSADEGETWSAGIDLPGGGVSYGFKNQCLCFTAKGRIVIPVYGGGKLACFISDDLGRSWRRSKPFEAHGADGKRIALDESQAVELADGTLALYSRSYVDRQFVAYSKDGGETWSEPVPSVLVSPGSPCTLLKLKNGDWMVAWNDLRGHPEYFGHGCCNGWRRLMALAVSKDEGRTWIHRRVLEGATNPWTLHYDYPSMFQTDDGHVLVHYCYIGRGRKYGLEQSHIVRVPLAWIYSAPEQTTDFADARGFLDRFQ